MKIAITASGSDIDARVSDRPGTASHLLVIDLLSGDVKNFKGPKKMGPGSGLQFVTMAIGEECDAFLTGWISPVSERQLIARGIKVVTGMTGTARDVLDGFEREQATDLPPVPEGPSDPSRPLAPHAVTKAGRRALLQITSMLPIIAGVIFLVGLLVAFIPDPVLARFFCGNALQGIFKGALVGSLFTGNPANSYIIGRQLLDQGIGLGAVTALICSWVTVGLVQMPAESLALGRSFAIVRNILSFILSMGIALVMMGVFRLLEG